MASNSYVTTPFKIGFINLTPRKDDFQSKVQIVEPSEDLEGKAVVRLDGRHDFAGATTLTEVTPSTGD